MSSLVYMEKPLHRRYAQTSHHSFTWHVDHDAQMPFDTPMVFHGWLAEITGFGSARLHLWAFRHISTQRYTPMMRDVIPETEFDRITLNARTMTAI
ncbi:MAG: hypothetical protein AAF231_07265 [Pseudomonadota bacterium]